MYNYLLVLLCLYKVDNSIRYCIDLREVIASSTSTNSSKLKLLSLFNSICYMVKSLWIAGSSERVARCLRETYFLEPALIDNVVSWCFLSYFPTEMSDCSALVERCGVDFK